MKRVPDSYAASTRSTRIATSGPGPIERGSIKQGMSPGKWPGTRTAGNQGPGREDDSSARKFAGPLGSRAGG